MRSRAYFLLAATATGCIACSNAPKPTVEYIAHPEQYRAAAESFNLTVAEQRRLEKRALRGDITAAKRLVDYHDGLTGDEQQYRRWMAVVARLEKQRRDKSQ